MHLSNYTVVADARRAAHGILFNGCTGAIDVVPEKVALAVRDNPPRISLLSKKTRESLARRGHLVADKARQRKVIASVRQALRARNRRTSSFFLLVTYSCQLRCSYCCQQERWSTSDAGDREVWMTPDVVDAAFEAMRALNDARVWSLNLYGGEPLQARGLAVIRLATELARKSGYKVSATTNGLHGDVYAPLAGPSGIAGVCFSLSGTAVGQAWARLSRNVDAFLEEGCDVAVRVNVDSGTIDALPDLFQRASRERWYGHPRLFWNVCPIMSPGRSRAADLAPQEYGKKIEGYLRAGTVPTTVETDLAAARQLSGVLRTGIPSPVHPRHPSFCGSKRGAFVLDPLGRIYTCHEAVRSEEASVGVYFPTLQIDEDALRQQATDGAGTEPRCSECPYVLLCDMGCSHRSRDPGGHDSDLCGWVDTSMRLGLRDICDLESPSASNTWL